MNLTIILFLIGVLGFVLNRKNIILMLISIEIMLLSITFLILVSSLNIDDIIGQTYAIRNILIEWVASGYHSNLMPVIAKVPFFIIFLALLCILFNISLPEPIVRINKLSDCLKVLTNITCIKLFLIFSLCSIMLLFSVGAFIYHCSNLNLIGGATVSCNIDAEWMLILKIIIPTILLQIWLVILAYNKRNIFQWVFFILFIILLRYSIYWSLESLYTVWPNITLRHLLNYLDIVLSCSGGILKWWLGDIINLEIFVNLPFKFYSGIKNIISSYVDYRGSSFRARMRMIPLSRITINKGTHVLNPMYRTPKVVVNHLPRIVTINIDKKTLFFEYYNRLNDAQQDLFCNGMNTYDLGSGPLDLDVVWGIRMYKGKIIKYPTGLTISGKVKSSYICNRFDAAYPYPLGGQDQQAKAKATLSLTSLVSNPKGCYAENSEFSATVTNFDSYSEISFAHSDNFSAQASEATINSFDTDNSSLDSFDSGATKYLSVTSIASLASDAKGSLSLCTNLIGGTYLWKGQESVDFNLKYSYKNSSFFVASLLVEAKMLYPRNMVISEDYIRENSIISVYMAGLDKGKGKALPEDFSLNNNNNNNNGESYESPLPAEAELWETFLYNSVNMAERRGISFPGSPYDYLTRSLDFERYLIDQRISPQTLIGDIDLFVSLAEEYLNYYNILRQEHDPSICYIEEFLRIDLHTTTTYDLLGLITESGDSYNTYITSSLGLDPNNLRLSQEDLLELRLDYRRFLLIDTESNNEELYRQGSIESDRYDSNIPGSELVLHDNAAVAADSHEFLGDSVDDMPSGSELVLHDNAAAVGSPIPIPEGSGAQATEGDSVDYMPSGSVISEYNEESPSEYHMSSGSVVLEEEEESSSEYSMNYNGESSRMGALLNTGSNTKESELMDINVGSRLIEESVPLSSSDSDLSSVNEQFLSEYDQINVPQVDNNKLELDKRKLKAEKQKLWRLNNPEKAKKHILDMRNDKRDSETKKLEREKKKELSKKKKAERDKEWKRKNREKDREYKRASYHKTKDLASLAEAKRLLRLKRAKEQTELIENTADTETEEDNRKKKKKRKK